MKKGIVRRISLLLLVSVISVTLFACNSANMTLVDQPTATPSSTAVQLTDGNATPEVKPTSTAESLNVNQKRIKAKGLYLTASSAGARLDHYIELANTTEINSYVIDVKNDYGIVSYDSKVPLASEIGAIEKLYDVDNLIKKLHDNNIYAIARIVCFKDPILAKSKPEMAIKNPEGGLYVHNEMNWVNPYNKDVWQYNIDLAKEVSKRLGVEFKAQPIDWDAKEMELSTGNIDCIWNGFTMTPEREEALSFTKPYLNNDQVLIVKADSGLTKLADMAGKKVGLQNGSSAQAAVDSNTEFAASLKDQVFYKENLTALNDLIIGGVDGVVMDSVVAAYDIAQSKKPLVIVNEVLSKEAYGVGFRKGDVKLRDEVQKILEEMANDGTVAAISTKWFGSDISVIGK